MAITTYTWQDVYSYVSRHTPVAKSDSGMVLAVNVAQNLIWNKYDWRETIEPLPPFWVVGGVQDYDEVPADFQGLRDECFIVDVESNQGRNVLLIKRNVPVSSMRMGTNMIGYESSTNKFRIWPRPADFMCPTQYIIDGRYKKVPTKITTDNVGSLLLPWADAYFDVCTAALQWALEDSRSQAKNMLKVMALQAVMDMGCHEGIELGDPIGVSPKEPLVRRYWIR
jgi:hypothetical protein